MIVVLCTCNPYKKENNPQLIISEVGSSNGSYQDEDGDYSDWIELYNQGEQAVDLSGWYLSDDSQNVKRWQLPKIELLPDSYLVIYASGKDKVTEDGNLHTNFKLDCMGETLYLSDAEGKLSAYLEIPEIPFDHSYGFSQEEEKYRFFENGTPGNKNGMNGYLLKASSDVEFSVLSGVYGEEIFLEFQTTEKNAEIYYTLDGSMPTENAALYDGEGFYISDRTMEPNRYTSIWTSPDDWDGQEGYSYNPNPQYKATVVKTRLYFPEENAWSEKTWTNTYLIGADYSLPVVSLSFQEDDLFDSNTGIYVPGDAYENYLATAVKIDPEPRNRTGNYSEDRKVVGYLEYFTESGSKVMENNVTMRICGNISRGSGMKSLTVYAWGDDNSGVFEYPIFGEENKNISGETVSKFTSIRLRNFGNDWRRSKFRDALGQSLVQGLNMGTQGYQPCILLMNGEYFGLCEIRENRDELFYENHLGISVGNLEKVKIPDIGKVEETKAQQDFLKLVEYVKTTDLSNDQNFSYVESQMDVDQFMDYVLIQLYLQNIDWLTNNCDFFRAIVPGVNSANEDGRWRVILYDVDYSINYEQENNYETFFASDSYCAVLMRGLLQNEEYKDRFIQRFDDIVCCFEPNRAIEMQQHMEEQMAPEIQEDLSRWTVYYEGEIRKTVQPSYWYEKMEDLRKFFRERPEYARNYFYESLQ